LAGEATYDCFLKESWFTWAAHPGGGEAKAAASTTCPATSNSSNDPAPAIVTAQPHHDVASERQDRVASAR
jgi:hypothetical protein